MDFQKLANLEFLYNKLFIELELPHPMISQNI